ncbi:MAG: sulfatase-like hydrolase/transferase [bacterium]|nr:sulfatase-like hydrolase/transferase [bacterium]
MSRRLLPLTCLFCLPAAVALAQPANDERPNILFVFTDDHAPHAIGAYGGLFASVDPTPNIDQLASEGMLFQSSFCTNSICGPSRAVILTGKHSHRNGFQHNGQRFDGSQQTFPKLLQGAGYRTAMIGKWHLSSDPEGFDHWEVLPGQGDYYNPVFLNAGGRRQIEGYCTDIVTDLAIDWLKSNADSGEPFMLMCQQKAPHRNWMPALRHLNLFDGETLPEPPTLLDRWEDNASPARFQEMEIDRHMNIVHDLFVEPTDGWDPRTGNASDTSGSRNLKKMTPEQREAWTAALGPENAALREAELEGEELVRWKYQRYMKNYLRCIRGVDESVGRLMAYLEESGLADNTIVIYSSDQGFYLGDHGWYDKRWMYEESLGMPLIVKWPGVTEPGARDTHLVQNLDYAETFLDIAGVEIPDDMQGRSLVPLMRGEKPTDWRDAIYYHYYEYPSVHMVPRHYGIRTDRYKLMRFYRFGEWEFYDLENDPDELANQYANPDYRETITALSEDLGALRARYGDDSDTREMPAAWQARFRPKKGEWLPLFNGKNLDGWTVKITGHELGDNYKDTFRVENGLLRVTYDGYERFDGKFGHLFFDAPFASYKLRVEYRFVGEQCPGGPGWAFRNSGVMLHGQSAESMTVDQEFPVSIEAQMLGGGGEGTRTTGNLCTPGTHVVFGDELVKRHCTNSTSKTYHGDQWVTLEVEVRGGDVIRHVMDGETVLEYHKPQLDESDADAQRLRASGTRNMLRQGTISLQAESHPLEFRKVEIQLLGR